MHCKSVLDQHTSHLAANFLTSESSLTDINYCKYSKR